MSETSILTGADQAIKLQSIGLFHAVKQRPTTLNRLAGTFPKGTEAEAGLKLQTKNSYPIVRAKDLQKAAGDTIQFDFINPPGGKPFMGRSYVEGKGYAMTFASDSLVINQTRYPLSAGDTMSQQRTVHQLRNLAMAMGYGYMVSLSDQRLLVHMAGARGFASGGEWIVPLASDADFTNIMINSVEAPTYNRHFCSNGSGIEHMSATGSEHNISTGDVANLDMIDSIRTWIDSVDFPPAPVIFDGDQAAYDAPLRVLLCSSEQYTSIIQSATGAVNFRTLQAQAMARAQLAKNNPLFMGDAQLWNGILIVKMPKPIRFYAGNAINWCASATSSTETTTDLVSTAFSTTHAVDRALLLGGQAVAEAWGNFRVEGGKKMDGPFFISEKWLDHGDKLEIVTGLVDGISKIRFNVNTGVQTEPTDVGIVAIDTAVRLAGV